MAIVKISKSDSGRLYVNAPYNSEFIKKAKELGGRWSGDEWVFDARDEERVRAESMTWYGTDGMESNTCTVRLLLEPDDGVTCRPLSVHGRTIAKATGRDSGAKLGDGIVVINGGFTSGGSINNWRTNPRTGTVALVRDFPRKAADALIQSGEGWISIEMEEPVINSAELQEERARLTKRILEINSLLEEQDKEI